jgi:hypothetical protein
VCIFERACTRNEGRWSNLENDGTSDTHCELYHKHEQEGDNVAADGSLAALADAVDADYAGQEPHDSDEDYEALREGEAGGAGLAIGHTGFWLQ